MGAIAVLALLSPAIYSYTSTMLQPSSLPLLRRLAELAEGEVRALDRIFTNAVPARKRAHR